MQTDNGKQYNKQPDTSGHKQEEKRENEENMITLGSAKLNTMTNPELGKMKN